jgi:hypothetical protein
MDIIELVRFPAIRDLLNCQTLQSYNEMSPFRKQVAREFLQNAVSRIDANSEGFFHRHQGTWLMIRACARSALIILGTALQCQKLARDSIRRNVESESNETDAPNTAAAEEIWGRIDCEILPKKWRNTVLQVLNLLREWKTESKDIERLYTIMVILFTQLSI